VDRYRIPLARLGQPDPQCPPVLRHRRPLGQAAPLDPVDEPGDPGLVDAEQPGELGHAPRPLRQDAQQPGLSDRQAVRGGRLREHAVHQPRQADQPGRQIGSGRCRLPGSRHSISCSSEPFAI